MRARSCAVPGVDGCFVGPADLNISLGFSPEVAELGTPTEAGIATILQIAQEPGRSRASTP